MYIYFEAFTDGSDDLMAVTEKDFFRKHGKIDPGSGPDYDRIDADMRRCGAVPATRKSVYAPGETTFGAILSGMSRIGHEMVYRPGIADEN